MFITAQISPWIHVGGSVGVDGIGFALGVDNVLENGDVISADIEVKAGWGSIALFAIPEVGSILAIV